MYNGNNDDRHGDVIGRRARTVREEGGEGKTMPKRRRSEKESKSEVQIINLSNYKIKSWRRLSEWRW